MKQTFLKTSDVREEKNEPSFGRESVHLNLTILISHSYSWEFGDLRLSTILLRWSIKVINLILTSLCPELTWG